MDIFHYVDAKGFALQFGLFLVTLIVIPNIAPVDEDLAQAIPLNGAWEYCWVDKNNLKSDLLTTACVWQGIPDICQ